MVKYSCEKCGKEFSQKSHYDSHNRRKTPCENNADKIKQLVYEAVEEKLKELNNYKNLIVENKNTNVNTVIQNEQTTQPNLTERTIPKKVKIKKKKKLVIVDSKLKVASMFAGCGGLDFAFHKQNDKFDIVYANDFDKDSCNTYEKYYKYKPVCQDITKINYI